MFDGRSPVPKSSSRPPKTAIIVARKIVEDIRRSNRAAGDKLPSESAMVDLYSVGRGTLRESLRFLELQGVISLRPGPGGGPTVERPDASSLTTTVSLLMQFTGAPFRTVAEARRGLEPMMAQLAAARMTTAEIAELETTIVNMEEHIDQQERFLVENKNFHDLIAHGSGNMLFGFLVDALLDILDGSAIGIDYPKTRRDAVLVAHKNIFDAISGRDPSRSADAMTQHIDAYLRYAEVKFPEILAEPIVWVPLDR